MNCAMSRYSPLRLPPASLERWMREFYFATEIDIGSSGVEPYTMQELRAITGIGLADLDAVSFHDSPTAGAGSLRQVIADRWAAGDAERVLVTHGSSEAIYLVMNSVVGRGEEVVAPAPCYQQLRSICEAAGCRIRTWDLARGAGFSADISALRRLVTSRTRLVVVNFPHNPTGVSVSPAEYRELLDIVAGSRALLLWDGAFSPLVYGSDPLPDPSGLCEDCISIGTLSKAFGLPGLRLGWCIAPPDVLERMMSWRDYVTLHLSPLTEFLGREAVRHCSCLLAPRLEQARRNRGLLAAWVDERKELVDWTLPAGGVCAFVRFREMRDTEPLCRFLAHQHKTLLVPGSCFGMPEFVRLGFGGSTASFQRGIEFLSRCLEQSSVMEDSVTCG